MEISNKDIQRIRTMSYFVEAAHKIIESEGIDGVTVRKVSKLAGYNPATLYNYFDNLDYLVGFASIKYLQDYHQSLRDEVEPLTDPEQRFLAIWEKFCYYSFAKPKIYRALFFKSHGFTLCEIFDYYFRMFPDELGDHTLDIQMMMKGCTLIDRNMYVLLAVVHSKKLKVKGPELKQLNEMMITLYRGKLTACIEDEFDEARQSVAVAEMVGYVKTLINLYK